MTGIATEADAKDMGHGERVGCHSTVPEPAGRLAYAGLPQAPIIQLQLFSRGRGYGMPFSKNAPFRSIATYNGRMIREMAKFAIAKALFENSAALPVLMRTGKLPSPGMDRSYVLFNFSQTFRSCGSRLLCSQRHGERVRSRGILCRRSSHGLRHIY